MTESTNYTVVEEIGQAWTAFVAQLMTFLQAGTVGSYTLVADVGDSSGYRAVQLTVFNDEVTVHYIILITDIPEGQKISLRAALASPGISTTIQKHGAESSLSLTLDGIDAYVNPTKQLMLETFCYDCTTANNNLILVEDSALKWHYNHCYFTAQNTLESFTTQDAVLIFVPDENDSPIGSEPNPPQYPGSPTFCLASSAGDRIAQATEDIAAGDTSVAINYGSAIYTAKGGTTTS